MPKPEMKTRSMTETTFYILLALVEPLHGYGVMKKVKKLSEGTVSLGAGTLYGAFSTLYQDRLIEIVREDERRKYYQLTGKGKKVLLDQIDKLEIMVNNGRQLISKSRQTSK
jgi:DNA-binding PadR family transcriptional regulator